MTPPWLTRAAAYVWGGEAAVAATLRGLLAPAAYMHRVAVGGRNAAYDLGYLRVERVPAWVIAVGNLTVGGSGKTPSTLWIAEALQRRGRRVAIVARGYGKARAGVVVVSRGQGPEVSARDGGDEAVMMANRFTGPVVTGEVRAAAAQTAVAQFGVDTIVVDDGFQHRALHRDVDLLLLPAADVVPRLLPAGPFREPLSSAARAQVLLSIGRSGRWAAGRTAATLARPTFRATIVPRSLLCREGSSWRERPVAELRGERVTIVAGIAHPERVVATVRALGATVVGLRAYPDHHAFTLRDLEQIRAGAQGSRLLCTEKDAVKLVALPGNGAFDALRVELEVENGDALLDQLLAGAPGLDFTPECRVDGPLRKGRPAMAISKNLLDILVCPQCKGDVRMTAAGNGLECQPCGLRYPITDDIPIMLIDEAQRIN